MIKFEKQAPKEWLVITDKYEPITLNLLSSTVTNKYHIVTEYIERVAQYNGDEFVDWLITLLKDCEDEKRRPRVIISNLYKLKYYIDSYMDAMNFDYDQFVDLTKAKKHSILFKADEIREIIQFTGYLKIYSLISNNEKLRLGQTLHKEIFNILADSILDTKIIKKIYDVIQTKTFRYNLTDKFMWEYIKKVQGKDIGIHVVEIFNFIMKDILIICEENKNPITYFIGVIDESVKWFLRSVYKGSIVYDDSISTEDIQGTHTDNLKTYSYNDTLGRLKGIAYEKIYELLQKQTAVLTNGELSDKHIIEFHERASSIQYNSPLSESIIFPVLSKMTDIPFQHFRTLSPEHTAVIAVYIQTLFRKVFGGADYGTLFSLLNFYPLKQPSVGTTYTIKRVHEFIDHQNETKNFFGFDTKILPNQVISHFVGRASRIDFTDILTGKSLGGIPLSKLESNMIQFFTLYFASKLDEKIGKMTKLMNYDF